MKMGQNESAEMGMNKTGIATAPKLSKDMIDSSSDVAVLAGGNLTPDDLRAEYSSAE
jgi:hypothetical protein